VTGSRPRDAISPGMTVTAEGVILATPTPRAVIRLRQGPFLVGYYPDPDEAVRAVIAAGALDDLEIAETTDSEPPARAPRRRQA